MAAAGNELEGVPLRYLIGADGPWDGRDGELIMAPYGTDVAPRRGYSAKYVNLYREDGEPQGYGPYLPRTATAGEYNEGVPDPNGAGFWRNLEEQLTLAKRGGFAFIETDNRDGLQQCNRAEGVRSCCSTWPQGALQESRHQRP